MTKIDTHTFSRLRRPPVAGGSADHFRRALGLRPAGVMTPTELRAEVLAVLG